MISILINGQESDQICILDRGFQYGDGLFETIRITAGYPQYWQQHIDRLFDGCDRLHIPKPSPSVLQAEAMNLSEKIKDGVLKIIVTRGSGGRGYSTTSDMQPTRVLAVFPLPEYSTDYWTKGVVVRLCETRLGINPTLAGIKHLNRLEQILARTEWEDSKYQEGLMMDTENNVIEGTMTNLFYVKNNELYTSDLSRCGVRGVMRDQIIKIASEMKMNLHETTIALDALYESDEIFISNSVIGIWPVRKLASNKYTVGPVCHQISQTLNNKKHGMENVA